MKFKSLLALIMVVSFAFIFPVVTFTGCEEEEECAEASCGITACCTETQCYYEWNGTEYQCDGTDCTSAAEEVTADACVSKSPAGNNSENFQKLIDLTKSLNK